MSCNSCGKTVPVRIQRVTSAAAAPKREPVVMRLGSRKLMAQTARIKPTNNLDKHRA